MANEQLKFEISVDGEEKLLAALKEIEGRLDKVQGAQTKVATATTATSKSVSSFTDGLSGAALKFNVYVAAAQQVVGVVKQVADKFDELHDAQEGFANDVDQASGRISGLVSKLTLMQVGSAQAAMGLKLTNEEFSRFIVFAKEYSEKTGKNFVQVTNELNQALLSGSQEGLRKFNISATDTRAAIEELTKAVGSRGVEGEGLAAAFDMLSAASDDVFSEFDAGLQSTNDLTFGLNGLEEVLNRIKATAYAAGQNLEVAATIAAGILAAPLTLGGSAVAAAGALGALATSEDANARAAQLNAAGAPGAVAPPPDVSVEADMSLLRRRGRGGSRRRAAEPDMSFSEDEVYGAEDAALSKQLAANDLDSSQKQAEIIRAQESAAEAKFKLDAENAAHMQEQNSLLREQQDLYKSIADTVGGALNDAIWSAIEGHETLGEAIKRVVAQQLKGIAQTSLVRSLEEFAEAIAQAANLNAPGASAHALAGAKFLGVAAAAGAGAAVVGGGSGGGGGGGGGGSAPRSSPTRSSSDGAEAGRTIVINLNSDIVTAGTHAELGRKLKELLSDGEAKYGS